MQAVKKAATGQFGSGWVWLAVDRSNYDVAPTDPEALVVVATPNQVMSKKDPLECTGLCICADLLDEPCSDAYG